MFPLLKLHDGPDRNAPQNGEALALLSRLLREKGYPVPEANDFGPEHQRAVEQFQHDQGLLASGIVDVATWELLMMGRHDPRPDPPFFSTTYPPDDADLLRQLEALPLYAADVRNVAARYGLPSSLLVGLGSRESGWGLALSPPGAAGTTDRGHKRGLLQIDDRWHPSFAHGDAWKVPAENLRYGAALLRGCLDILTEKYGWPYRPQTLRAAVAAYNCGPRRVYEAHLAGQDVDYFTAGRNYSADVLSRAGWFQRYGWD